MAKGTKRLVGEVLQRLEAQYGIAQGPRLSDPTDELVACILSQHTSDANSIPAFERLKATYPKWALVVEADSEVLADVIRSAGLANTKAKYIQSCLKELFRRTGAFSLQHLAAMSSLDARKWLETLPGVGPKTASIVLCFSFGMDVLPVDTHVFRVSWRLGLIDRKIGESKAHDVLSAMVPHGMAYRFHMALIQHGREVCRARTPRCERCVIQNLCWWARAGRVALSAKV